MALADYYARGALAAAQVLEGFDESRFLERLDSTPIGIALDDTIQLPEGRALAELLVRLLARLYPRVALMGPGTATRELASLATSINPAIEITEQGTATIGVSIGATKGPFETTFYAGAAGWHALLSTTQPQPLSDSENPFGAGTAACLVAANIFRRVFLTDWRDYADDALCFSAWSLDVVDQPTRLPQRPWRILEESVLVGVGAVGNAALWALARAPLEGAVHVVDPQDIELSNVQRYVLAARADEGRSKVELAASLATRRLTIIPYRLPVAEFLSRHGYSWRYFLLGLDSARDRRLAQAALPQWIANAWTQPSDLGVSVHPRFGDGSACVACLYRQDSKLRNEDEIVAQALNVPQLLMEVRALLYGGTPLQRAFLETIARAIERPTDALLRFEGRSIRDLYVEGVCGGAVIPLGEAGQPPKDLHVPLAHQSALAGVLLAAAFVRSTLGGDPHVTSATRFNLLKAVGSNLAQPLRAKNDGRCICDDPVFRTQYGAKYSPA